MPPNPYGPTTMHTLPLAHGNIGIERETLRTILMPLSPAPPTLPLSAAPIPTRTSPPTTPKPCLNSSPTRTHAERAYAQLLSLHRYCAQHIGDEQLWPGSMPCILPASDDAIAIGYYGTSNGGKMRRLYREGSGAPLRQTMQ